MVAGHAKTIGQAKPLATVKAVCRANSATCMCRAFVPCHKGAAGLLRRNSDKEIDLLKIQSLKCVTMILLVHQFLTQQLCIKH